MIVGFTGTRDGLTSIQKERLSWLFKGKFPFNRYDTLLHGGAAGADEIAHDMALAVDFSIEIYPCDTTRRKHWVDYRDTSGEMYITIHAVRDPLERNRIIANRCNHLIAAPFQMSEVRRSGTWATIRYAREYSKSITIIFPDGSIEEERRDGRRNNLAVVVPLKKD